MASWGRYGAWHSCCALATFFGLENGLLPGFLGSVGWGFPVPGPPWTILGFRATKDAATCPAGSYALASVQFGRQKTASEDFPKF